MMTETACPSVLRCALEAAIEAGDYLKSRFQTELVVRTKSSLADVVTDVDAHCEELIRARISNEFPEHDILGEEGVAPGRDASMEATLAKLESTDLWIVDPLDGTTNYVSGIPLSVVSIAYAVKGVIQTGVIYDPYRNEIFYATRGQGSFLSTITDVEAWLKQPESPTPGTRLRTKETELRGAVLATGLPMRHANRPLMMERVSEIIQRVKSLRTLGAAALHMAYTAAGRIDIFFEFELNVWDVAAGVLLITEAGGRVVGIDGQAYSLMSRDILASGNASSANSICKMLDGQFEDRLP